jgi:hypothetical protein
MVSSSWPSSQSRSSHCWPGSRDAARDGVYPHHVSRSYHNRNTPLAQDRAGYLGLAGIAVAVGTLAGVMRVERRKAVAGRRGRASPPVPRNRDAPKGV